MPVKYHPVRISRRIGLQSITVAIVIIIAKSRASQVLLATYFLSMFYHFMLRSSGQWNGEAIADAHTESDYQEINGACAPHCRE